MDFDVSTLNDSALIAYNLLNCNGREAVIEFKPKETWPKEGNSLPKGDRYMAACLINGEWITVIDYDVNIAVEVLYNKVLSVALSNIKFPAVSSSELSQALDR